MSNIQKVLLISEKNIKEISYIQLNVDSKTLSRTIFDTQNIYLEPILGTELFNTVIDAVFVQASVPLTEKYRILLQDFIHPWLAHAVTQDIIINLHYKITNKGFLKFNDTQATALNPDEIEYAKNYHDNRASSYKSRLIKHLQAEGYGVEKRGPDRDITTESIGWFLDGKSSECCGSSYTSTDPFPLPGSQPLILTLRFKADPVIIPGVTPVEPGNNIYSFSFKKMRLSGLIYIDLVQYDPVLNGISLNPDTGILNLSSVGGLRAGSTLIVNVIPD